MTRGVTSRKRRTWPALRRIPALLLLAYVGLCILAALLYPYLLYHPDGSDNFGTPAAFASTYENVWLTASDGVKLHGWFIPAPETEGAATGLTLLVFHGNAGNVGTELERLRIYHRLGVAVFIVDYHGYGQSGGSASEKNLYLDAEAAWEYLIRERGIEPKAIVVLGYSLGGAVASWLAERNPEVAGLVLESTFTKLSHVASELFPWLPAGLILGDAYNTEKRLENMAMPLLVAHGRGDQLVPFACGEQIHAMYKGPKMFVVIGNDHNLGFLTAETVYVKGLRDFLGTIETGNKKTPPRL